MADVKGRKIEVKQIDIKRGNPLDPWYCPIARAIQRAFKLPVKETGHVAVSNRRVIFEWTGLTYPLPKKAKDFIKAFDHGKKVKPFSFVLRAA